MVDEQTWSFQCSHRSHQGRLPLSAELTWNMCIIFEIMNGMMNEMEGGYMERDE